MGSCMMLSRSPSILPPHIQPLRGTADRHVPAECGKWGRCPPGRGSVWPGAGAAARSRRRLHQTPSQTPNPAHSPGMAGHVALDETESALDGRVGKSWQEEDRTQSCLSNAGILPYGPCDFSGLLIRDGTDGTTAWPSIADKQGFADAALQRPTRVPRPVRPVQAPVGTRCRNIQR